MNIQQLEYFINIAETLNYSKSAELLGLSQPALSMSINKLEEELGFSLFAKHGRNIKLTDSGSLYYKTAQDTLKMLETGAAEAKSLLDAHTDYLTIAITNNVMQPFISKLLVDFIDRYPEIKLNIHQKDFYEVVNMLKTANVDWIIGPLHQYIYDKNGISYEKLIDQTIYAVMSSNHELAKSKEIHMADILSQTCLINNEFWQGKISYVLSEKGIDSSNIDFRFAPPIDTILNRLLENPHTIYITNAPSQKMQEKDNLKIIPIVASNGIMESYVLAWYKQKKTAGPHQLFYDFVIEHCKQ